MAQPIDRKAKALAMLMTGHSVKETAEACSVPKQTISRWKLKDMPEFLQPIVVASLESNGGPSYPGSLSGVVAVKSDASFTRDEIMLVPDKDRVVFAAAPYPRPIPGVPRERNLFGSSFAVANVTGFLARLLEKERIGTPAALASRLRAIIST